MGILLKIWLALFSVLAIVTYAEVTEIALGGSLSCALLTGGAIKCWGDNSAGQLGDGTTTSRTTPVEVSGIKTATSIALGSEHSCAILEGGNVMCWGNGENGELGNDNHDESYIPVEVSRITNATSISLGGSHSCALLTDATVVCWGYNGNGQLGDGTTDDIWTPVKVDGITTATSISLGGHSCAVLTDSTVLCWGKNNFGQLGDRTIIDRYNPVEVVWIPLPPLSPPPPPNATDSCGNYVILDGTSRDDTSQGCQDEYMTIPSGCVIAPRTDENIAMIAEYYWGTHGICLADGTCWWGLHGGGDAGTQDCSQGSDGFQTTTIDGEVAYMPPCCSERILLECTNSMSCVDVPPPPPPPPPPCTRCQEKMKKRGYSIGGECTVQT